MALTALGDFSGGPCKTEQMRLGVLYRSFGRRLGPARLLSPALLTTSSWTSIKQRTRAHAARVFTHTYKGRSHEHGHREVV
jgi:hypothetical protein